MSPAKPSSRATSPRGRAPRFLKPAIAVLALALVAGGVWWWQGSRASTGEGQWRTVPVERGDIRVAISATGTLSATSTVIVGSQISGQVTDVLVDFNDTVEAGQVIARIDPSTYQAQIDQGNAQVSSARASLAQAEAALRNAELDYRRKSDLGDTQLVARADVDLADIGLVDLELDLHLRQILGDGEQLRCLQAGGHGLAGLDIADQHHAVDR